MFSYGPWFRLTCVALYLLITGLIFDQASGDPFIHLTGKEGWGMDPNGGRAAVREIAPPVTDSLP